MPPTGVWISSVPNCIEGEYLPHTPVHCPICWWNFRCDSLEEFSHRLCLAVLSRMAILRTLSVVSMLQFTRSYMCTRWLIFPIHLIPRNADVARFSLMFCALRVSVFVNIEVQLASISCILHSHLWLLRFVSPAIHISPLPCNNNVEHVNSVSPGVSLCAC